MSNKPLFGRAYGSIGHLPNSRLGPADRSINEGQARICTVKTRDRHDRIVVQEKLDGSCTAVLLQNGEIIPLIRAGYRADTSPYEQHHMFAAWVKENEDRFRKVLLEGERLVGEWLAQAHGTLYDFSRKPPMEPWIAFDLMNGNERLTYSRFYRRVQYEFMVPHLLHYGGAISTEDAMALHAEKHFPCDQTEGVVYRVERDGRVDYLTKWVRPDKIDGKYLPEISGEAPVWNWRPCSPGVPLPAFS